METLKLFESSIDIERVTFDKACDMNEAVELSFENDTLSFDSVIEEGSAVEPVEEEPVKTEEPKKSSKKDKDSPLLEIDEDTKQKILKWLQQIYNQNYSRGISETASAIWDHIHRADITYESLDREINELYKRVNSVTRNFRNY